MSKHDKVWQQILSGRSDYNINFNDLVSLLEHRGFTKRQRGGSHVIFYETGNPGANHFTTGGFQG